MVLGKKQIHNVSNRKTIRIRDDSYFHNFFPKAQSRLASHDMYMYKYLTIPPSLFIKRQILAAESCLRALEIAKSRELLRLRTEKYVIKIKIKIPRAENVADTFWRGSFLAKYFVSFIKISKLYGANVCFLGS